MILEKLSPNPAKPDSAQYLLGIFSLPEKGSLMVRFQFIFYLLSATLLLHSPAKIIAAEDHSHQGPLVIAVSSDYPPFSLLDINGQASGMLVDIWKLWAEKTGENIAFHISDRDGTLDAMKTGKADIHSGLHYSEARDQWMEYSSPFYVHTSSFYHHIEDPPPDLASSLQGVRIGVVRGDLQETFLKESYPEAIIVALANELTLINELQADTIDVFFNENLSIESLLVHTGMSGKINSIGPPLATNEVYSSVVNGRSTLLEKINTGLKDITQQEFAAIESHWVKGHKRRYFTKEKRITVKLNAQERAWIAANPIITTIALTNWAPIDFQGEQGGHVGIAADVLELAASRVGLEVQPQFGPWSEMLSKLEKGEIDLAPEIYRTEQREKVLTYSRPFLPLYNAIFIRKTNNSIHDVIDLKGKRVAIEKGYATLDFLQATHPEIQIDPVESTFEALKLVSMGKVDAYVGSQYVASYLLEEHLLPGLQAISLLGDGPQFLHMAVPKDREILRDIMDKALGSITEKEKRTIIHRYVPTSLGSPQERTGTRIVELTEEEKAYIKAHPQIRFGIDTSWPPFDFLDEEGKHSGISSNVVQLVSNVSGIKFIPELELGWGEVIQHLKSGKLTMIGMIQPTPEREQFIDFTRPYISFPSVILTRDDGPFVSSLEGLSGVVTGVGEGFSVEEYIKNHYPTIPLAPEANAETVLLKLSKGKTEAAVMNLAVATHIIGKLNLSNIKIAAPTDFSIDLAMGVKKGETALLSILQKSLNAISDGEIERIKNRWVALRVSFGLDMKTILSWALPLSASSLFIFAFILIWNRRLFREVKERKRVQRQLSESEERTRLILASAGEGIFGVNLEGKIIFINETACKMLGYSLSEIMGQEVHTLIHHSRPDGSYYPVEECPMRHAFTEGLVNRIDNEVLWCKDNSKFDVEYSAVPIKRAEEIIGAVVIFQDITAKIKAQRERDDAYQLITSSIQYASCIQRSVLPPDGRLEDFTSAHFIVWRPRDVVGGDMYWCVPWGDGGIIMLGDCTGHGVPGAFMTLIATGALERALLETPEGDTASLVSKMHQLIQLQLDQDNFTKGISFSDDGMELGLCYIPPGRKRMVYTGARMALYVDNGTTVEQIKADKKGVGYRSIPFDFQYTNREIEVKDNMRFLMTTDGIIDQIGGEKHRGFGKKRFLALLHSLRDYSLSDYGDRIYAELLKYEGEENRRDDISIIGFQL